MKRNGSWMMPARLWVVAVLAVACAAQPSAGQALGRVKKRAKTVKREADEQAESKEASLEDTETRVGRVLEAFRGEHDLPGMTCGWVLADGREGATAVGVSNRGSGEPMRPDDRMLSGSIGKTYVAAVMLKLVEKGRVDLDAEISTWFGEEEWFERLPNAKDLTLRMVMRHQTGIPRHLFLPEMQAAIKADLQREWKPEELISFVLDKEPLFAAGEGWAYADTNYILVGMIIERVTGKTYYQELRRQILRPLELKDTSPSDRAELRGLVSGYTSAENPFGLPEEVATEGTYAMNPQLEWTGGGLISTARDLARWASLLYGGKVLKPESMKEMLKGVPMDPRFGGEYGLGVMVRDSTLGPVWGHGGTMPGYVSMMGYYPQHGLAVAVQMNGDVGVKFDTMGKLLDAIAAEVLGK